MGSPPTDVAHPAAYALAMVIDPDRAASPDVLADRLDGLYSGPPTPSTRFEPSLQAARSALRDYDPTGYARTRNRVDGNVSELNPYITWGVFTPVEVQRAVRGRLDPGNRDYRKFVAELGWKAYFRTVFLELGERVYESLEPYKYPAGDKRDAWPEELDRGATGLPCIDAIVDELRSTGHVHNHARMWFAAYVVHFAKIEWWHGERFFFRHLLDGEPGPNALSWQWVASTFSAKPYIFNSSNMAENGHAPCPGAPFDASYEAIAERFLGGYGRGGYAERPAEQPSTEGRVPHPRLERDPLDDPVVLLHGERLSPAAAALAAVDDDRPVIVGLDATRFRDEQPSFQRLAFAVQLAADLARRLRSDGREVDLLLFDGVDELAAAVRARGASVTSADSWHPGTWAALDRLDRVHGTPVSVVADEPFARVSAPLRSFSSWWRRAERVAMAR